MNDERKDVIGYEQYYQVSRDGRVFSKGRQAVRRNGVPMTYYPKQLTPKDNGNGYLTVMLYNEHGGKRFYVHRLIAQTFVENPFNYPQVNHKDENKQNNCADNLEWCDSKYNLCYGTHTQRVASALSRAVVQYSSDHQFIKEYPSAMEAMRNTGIRQGSISRCCNGQQYHAGGFIWKYKDESEYTGRGAIECQGSYRR